MRAKTRDYFADYASYHRTKGNLITHIVGIPFIVLSTLGMLNRLVVVDTGFLITGSPALPLYIAVCTYYVFLSPSLGLATAVSIGGLYFLGACLSMPVLVGLFVVGWVLQYVGHLVYEKKAPAFYKNGLHLLIGPTAVRRKS